MIGWSDDNNYDYARVICQASGNPILELRRVAAGSDTLLDSVQYNYDTTDLDLVICYEFPNATEDGVVSAYVSNDYARVVKGRSTQTGRKAGLYFGQMTSGNFGTADDFLAGSEGAENGCGVCPCGCNMFAEPSGPASCASS